MFSSIYAYTNFLCMHCTYSMFHIHISAFKTRITGDLGVSGNFYRYTISGVITDFKNLLYKNGTSFQVHKTNDRPIRNCTFFVKLYISRKE